MVKLASYKTWNQNNERMGNETKVHSTNTDTNTEWGNIFGRNKLPTLNSPKPLILITRQVNGAGQLLYILYSILTVDNVKHEIPHLFVVSKPDGTPDSIFLWLGVLINF